MEFFFFALYILNDSMVVLCSFFAFYDNLNYGFRYRAMYIAISLHFVDVITNTHTVKYRNWTFWEHSILFLLLFVNLFFAPLDQMNERASPVYKHVTLFWIWPNETISQHNIERFKLRKLAENARRKWFHQHLTRRLYVSVVRWNMHGMRCTIMLNVLVINVNLQIISNFMFFYSLFIHSIAFDFLWQFVIWSLMKWDHPFSFFFSNAHFFDRESFHFLKYLAFSRHRFSFS